MRDRLSLFFFLSKYCFSGSCFIWWQIKGGWVRHCIRGFKQKNALNVVEGEKKKNRWNASVIEICKKKSQFFVGVLLLLRGYETWSNHWKKKKDGEKYFSFTRFLLHLAIWRNGRSLCSSYPSQENEGHLFAFKLSSLQSFIKSS